MKTNTQIKLSGYTPDGKASTQTAGQVVCFRNTNDSIRVRNTKNLGVVLETARGTYLLTRHDTIENLFTGVASGIKVHFTKKKIVGKLIFWA